jgi:hypothetical protein
MQPKEILFPLLNRIIQMNDYNGEKLTITDKLVLNMIVHLYNNCKPFNVTNLFIARKLNVSARAVVYSLAKLKRIGLLVIVDENLSTYSSQSKIRWLATTYLYELYEDDRNTADFLSKFGL